MTNFKIYRVSNTGYVNVYIAQAYDWQSLIMQEQYAGDPIFKIEVHSGEEPVEL